MKASIYEVTISHARSAPLRNVFRYRSYLWLVDLDHLPRVRLLAGFRARDHLGDPRASIRANLDRFLAARGVDLGGGRVTMLAHARVLGCVRGRAVPATARTRLAAGVRHPWSTAAVSVRIRWQGVRLYLRGLPVIPRPAHQSQEGVQ